MSRLAFPQTRWTILLAAKEGEGRVASEALEALALAYWKPVYVFLRRKGYTHEEGQDETQAFFEQLLRRDFLRNLQPEGGRFRNFLLVALRRRLQDQRERVSNVRKAAEVRMRPWHEMEARAYSPYPEAMTPEEAFDRSWAEQLVQRSMEAIEVRWAKRSALFREIRFTVEHPRGGARYAEIGEKLGMTEGAVAKAVYDLRTQFAEQVRRAVRDTVADDEDVEGELRHLVTLLGR